VRCGTLAALDGACYLQGVSEEIAGPERFWARRGRALLAAILFLLAIPMTSTAAARAAPMSAGDVMRTLYLAPDRKIDASQKGVAVAAPPPPPAEVQTASQPAPPTRPVADSPGPRVWLSPEPARKRRRRQP